MDSEELQTKRRRVRTLEKIQIQDRDIVPEGKDCPNKNSMSGIITAPGIQVEGWLPEPIRHNQTGPLFVSVIDIQITKFAHQ